jgi:hypothetical protein
MLPNERALRGAALVHLGAGIGNIVLATPLLVALSELGLQLDVLLSADYPEVADLFAGWSAVRQVLHRTDRATREKYNFLVPALPPFYWPRFRGDYRGLRNQVARPPEAMFYENEQEFYLGFARTLGYSGLAPYYTLPIGPAGDEYGVDGQTVVLAPGCKTGEMAAKRWPHFTTLAARFRDVVIAGTADDLVSPALGRLAFPDRVRSFAGKLTLRQTAGLMAASGLVIANDSGLAHVAGACGVPTVILFGPTPDRTLGHLPPNVTVLRSGLPCEPCWFGARFGECRGSIRCLAELPVDRVAQASACDSQACATSQLQQIL